MRIKMFEAFAGYGSQAVALSRIKERYADFDYEVVGISEIDKYAIKSYDALHGHCPNFGDIRTIDWDKVPDFDLFTYSSPCQDFSTAGHQKGGEEGSGTRSSLLWECRRAIIAKKPKFLLLENVKALTYDKFYPLLRKWVGELDKFGYRSFLKVLNSKDFGVPQSRERVFLVSILGNEEYHFPEPTDNTKRLRDVLEVDVDEKYILSEKAIATVMLDYKGFKGSKPKNENDLANTLVASYSKIQRGATYVKIEQVANFKESKNFKNPQVGRIYSNRGLSPTLTTCQGGGRVPKILFENDERIRSLTERECFRLMGLRDNEIDAIKQTQISGTQQYKQAGNSIVVNVLEAIFAQMFYPKRRKEIRLFD